MENKPKPREWSHVFNSLLGAYGESGEFRLRQGDRP